jgi:phage baseplate assembly protein W
MNTIIPFRRDKKQDFAKASGAQLLASKVRQVLLTEGATPRSSGELPWRTNFGAGLGLLRHQRNDLVLEELARVYVREALERWLPGVLLEGVQVERRNASLVVALRLKTPGRPEPASVQLTV